MHVLAALPIFWCTHHAPCLGCGTSSSRSVLSSHHFAASEVPSREHCFINGLRQARQKRASVRTHRSHASACRDPLDLPKRLDATVELRRPDIDVPVRVTKA